MNINPPKIANGTVKIIINGWIKELNVAAITKYAVSKAKAKIINYFDDQNASFVKVNINVKFNDTTLQVLKTIELEELRKQFKFV